MKNLIITILLLLLLLLIIIIIIIIIPTEYVKRHDGLAKVISQKLADAAELIDDKSPYY